MFLQYLKLTCYIFQTTQKKYYFKMFILYNQTFTVTPWNPYISLELLHKSHKSELWALNHCLTMGKYMFSPTELRKKNFQRPFLMALRKFSFNSSMSIRNYIQCNNENLIAGHFTLYFNKHLLIIIST